MTCECTTELTAVKESGYLSGTDRRVTAGQPRSTKTKDLKTKETSELRKMSLFLSLHMSISPSLPSFPLPTISLTTPSFTLSLFPRLLYYHNGWLLVTVMRWAAVWKCNMPWSTLSELNSLDVIFVSVPLHGHYVLKSSTGREEE